MFKDQDLPHELNSGTEAMLNRLLCNLELLVVNRSLPNFRLLQQINMGFFKLSNRHLVVE